MESISTTSGAGDGRTAATASKNPQPFRKLPARRSDVKLWRHALFPGGGSVLARRMLHFAIFATVAAAAEHRWLQAQVPCTSSYAQDYDYEACLGWCPNNPEANCDRCE